MTIVKETQYRTLAKLVTYRLIAAIASGSIGLYFGATLYGAAMFALTSLWLGGLIYYFHERAWLLTNFSRNFGNDSQLRSIIKTVTYRLAAMGAVFVTAMIMITDKAPAAAGFTLSVAIVNVALFYIIERIFNKINWGKIFAGI